MFDAIFKRLRKNIFTVVTNPSRTFFLDDGTLEKTQSKLTEKEAVQQYKSWTYTCANINAVGVASQKLRLYAVIPEVQRFKCLHPIRSITSKQYDYLINESTVKDSIRTASPLDVVEITVHPLLDLLREINPNRNNYETMEEVSIGLDLVGNSYWYVPKDALGMPKAIFNLLPQFVTIVPGKEKMIKGYLYGASDRDLIKFKESDIIHFKTTNPNDLFYGLGPAQAMATAINRQNMMDLSESSTLRNQGRPDFIVKYKGNISEGDLRDTEKAWNLAYGGPNRTGKIKVMDEDWDIKTIGFSPQEMNYIVGRQWTLKELSAGFGVPVTMLDTTDTKKATSELAERWHAKNGIRPRLKRIEQKLNEKLVPFYDDRIFLAYDNPVPEDRMLELRTNDMYIRNGVSTINEVRRELNKLPYDDEKFDMPFAGGKKGGFTQGDEEVQVEVDVVADVDEVEVEEVVGDDK